MYFCYLDEAGCTGALPSATSPVQPVFALVGLIARHDRLPAMVRRFVALKARFFPGRMSEATHPLDRILVEIKGSAVRRTMRARRNSERRHILGFLDHTLRLLESCEARIIGRILVKGIGRGVNGRSVYTRFTQTLCQHFQEWLSLKRELGLVIADTRAISQNVAVSHSVFTRKFKAGGDEYDRIAELPSFGHSENYGMLQMADLLCSGLVFPIACHAYCTGRVSSVHTHGNYIQLRTAFARRLRKLQYRYQYDPGRWTGGLSTSDQLAKRPPSLLLREP